MSLDSLLAQALLTGSKLLDCSPCPICHTPLILRNNKPSLPGKDGGRDDMSHWPYCIKCKLPVQSNVGGIDVRGVNFGIEHNESASEQENDEDVTLDFGVNTEIKPQSNKNSSDWRSNLKSDYDTYEDELEEIDPELADEILRFERGDEDYPLPLSLASSSTTNTKAKVPMDGDKVSAVMGKLLLKGYKMMSESCAECNVPYMLAPGGGNGGAMECVMGCSDTDADALPSPPPQSQIQQQQQKQQQQQQQQPPSPPQQSEQQLKIEELFNPSTAQSKLSQKMLSGYTMLSESCAGVHCGYMPLMRKRSKHNKKGDGGVFCVVCDGCGDGVDGKYLLLVDEQQQTTGDEGEGGGNDEEEKELKQAMLEIKQMKQSRESGEQTNSQKIAAKCISGYAMSASCCMDCNLPYVSKGGVYECVGCGYVGGNGDNTVNAANNSNGLLDKNGMIIRSNRTEWSSNDIAYEEEEKEEGNEPSPIELAYYKKMGINVPARNSNSTSKPSCHNGDDTDGYEREQQQQQPPQPQSNPKQLLRPPPSKISANPLQFVNDPVRNFSSSSSASTAAKDGSYGISRLLMKGWTMLDSVCKDCLCVLMRDPAAGGGGKGLCVNCDDFNGSNGSGGLKAKSEAVVVEKVEEEEKEDDSMYDHLIDDEDVVSKSRAINDGNDAASSNKGLKRNNSQINNASAAAAATSQTQVQAQTSAPPRAHDKGTTATVVNADTSTSTSTNVNVNTTQHFEVTPPSPSPSKSNQSTLTKATLNSLYAKLSEYTLLLNNHDDDSDVDLLEVLNVIEGLGKAIYSLKRI